MPGYISGEYGVCFGFGVGDRRTICGPNLTPRIQIFSQIPIRNLNLVCHPSLTCLSIPRDLLKRAQLQRPIDYLFHPSVPVLLVLSLVCSTLLYQILYHYSLQLPYIPHHLMHLRLPLLNRPLLSSPPLVLLHRHGQVTEGPPGCVQPRVLRLSLQAYRRSTHGTAAYRKELERGQL